MSEILNCKEVAKHIKEEVKQRSEALIANGTQPTMAIVRVGEKEADIAYEKSILKACQSVNITAETYNLPNDVTMENFAELLVNLNQNPQIHGILVFRPLPSQLDKDIAAQLINPDKDIDCMSTLNLVKVFEGNMKSFTPCTPAAVMEIIRYFDIDLNGMNTAVLGRSMVVGRPLSMMLMKQNATVTICHSKTRDTEKIVSKADLVIVAIGKAKRIGKDYIKPGATVIDVGINVDEDGNMCGDVNFAEVADIAGRITKVPGGVGSVTTTILLKNLVRAAEKMYEEQCSANLEKEAAITQI